MAVVNPADKYRGGDSASDILRNAARVGEELGVVVVASGGVLRIGDFVAEWGGGVVEAAGRSWRLEWWQWEGFKTLLLNYFVNFRRPPGREAVEAALFAVGAVPVGST